MQFLWSNRCEHKLMWFTEASWFILKSCYCCCSQVFCKVMQGTPWPVTGSSGHTAADDKKLQQVNLSCRPGGLTTIFTTSTLSQSAMTCRLQICEIIFRFSGAYISKQKTGHGFHQNSHIYKYIDIFVWVDCFQQLTLSLAEVRKPNTAAYSKGPLVLEVFFLTVNWHLKFAFNDLLSVPQHRNTPE